MHRMGTVAASAFAVWATAVAAHAQAPAPRPTPAPTVKLDKDAKALLAASAEKRRAARAARPAATLYDSLGRPKESPIQSFVQLKQSARAKIYVPTAMQNALTWSRTTPVTGTTTWERKGGWTPKDKWVAPNTWKGAGLEVNSASLTESRGPRLSQAERHPLRTTFAQTRSKK